MVAHGQTANSKKKTGKININQWLKETAEKL